MLADEYGYQVSPGPAGGFPGLAERLEREVRGNRTMGLTGIALWALFPASMAVRKAFPDTPHITYVNIVTLAVGLVLGSFCLVAWHLYARQRALLAVARAHPFQVWPCQLEQTADRKRVMLLLTPDGGVARELKAEIPDDVWKNTPDGRGVFWIAGDLRFTCLAATPGARTTWRAEGTPHAAPSTTSARGRLRPVEDELLRAATQSLLGNWGL